MRKVANFSRVGDKILFLAGLGLLLVVGLIWAGWFDPRPEGALIGSYALGEVTVLPEAVSIEWLHEVVPAGTFTLRLIAAGPPEEPLVGYGLAIGRPDNYLAVLVSPTGYVTMTEVPGRSFRQQWHTWPHIEPTSNEIQMEQDKNNRLTIRINRELFWQGEWLLAGEQIGLVGQGFAGQAVIDFQKLTIWGATLPSK